MKYVACVIHCSCSGRVERLVEGVAYVLTDKQTIVFGGICSQCGSPVQVEKPITTLMLHCPSSGKVQ